MQNNYRFETETKHVEQLYQEMYDWSKYCARNHMNKSCAA